MPDHLLIRIIRGQGRCRSRLYFFLCQQFGNLIILLFPPFLSGCQSICQPSPAHKTGQDDLFLPVCHPVLPLQELKQSDRLYIVPKLCLGTALIQTVLRLIVIIQRSVLKTLLCLLCQFQGIFFICLPDTGHVNDLLFCLFRRIPALYRLNNCLRQFRLCIKRFQQFCLFDQSHRQSFPDLIAAKPRLLFNVPQFRRMVVVQIAQHLKDPAVIGNAASYRERHISRRFFLPLRRIRKYLVAVLSALLIRIGIEFKQAELPAAVISACICLCIFRSA